MTKMSEGFSGEPVTRWNGERNMTLIENFYYIDPNEKQWMVPAGSYLNGATIPRALWTTVGAPYVGKYRRASVVHDYYVGELNNPDVSTEERKTADRMFYHACRYDGCSKRFAGILYIGVRFGTWSSTWSSSFREATISEEYDDIHENIEFDYIRQKFLKIIDEVGPSVEEEDLDVLDSVIEKNLAR